MQGGQGGWQKPEPEQPPPVQTERPSSLVGNSNWASRQQQDQASSFGQQPLVADSGYHTGYGARDRRLNPTEYPSLSAAAYAAQQQQTKQLQQQATNASQVHFPFMRHSGCWRKLTLQASHFSLHRRLGSGMRMKGMVLWRLAADCKIHLIGEASSTSCC